MKSIKIYLIVVSVLLVVALSAGVYVWFVFQSTQSQLENSQTQVDTDNDVAADSATDSAAAVEDPIIIQTDTLSESQQKTLSTFGFDGETITVTGEMISCAENAVGKERFSEITSGASPSPLEALKLLPCFKK